MRNDTSSNQTIKKQTRRTQWAAASRWPRVLAGRDKRPGA